MMAENRVTTSIKLCVVIVAVYGLYFVYIYRTRIEETKGSFYVIEEFENVNNSVHSVTNINKNMKYVLQWTRKSMPPFDLLGSGQSAFIDNKCKFTNCYVTDNRSYVPLTYFDAIVFNGKDVTAMHSADFPKLRSLKQKYIFGAMESADYYPLCAGMMDNYFNWTWTYKLNSDFRWGYITIYDLQGNPVGPAIDMKWPEDMEPISEDLKTKLSTKSKAAAWFVSNCYAKNRRHLFVKQLVKELEPFGWKVDVYGSCGKLRCPRSSKSCFEKVEKDYYFYLAFENSMAEDYVTEKLLTALNNYAVPIVYGAANYSRFLPESSYLDARKLGAKSLARVMNEIIGNKTLYYNFFRWRNHFVYKETSGNVDTCKLCEVLNDDQLVNNVSVWTNFREWWNGDTYESNCPKSKRTYWM